MKLELKHLAPYLPYGLKFKVNDTEHVKKLRSIPFLFGELHLEFGDNAAYEMQYCKPILRPMSDFNKIQNDFDITTDFESAYCTSSKDVAFVCTSDKVYLSDFNTVMDFVFKNHLDVFGLIDAGLAIDINTLEHEKH